MNQSEVINKIYSILHYRPQEQYGEMLTNYSYHSSDKISYDLLEMVWDRAVNGLLLTDSDGIIIAVNKAFCSMVNMKENELKGFLFTVIYDRTLDRKLIFDEYFTRVQNHSVVKKDEKNLRLNSGQHVKVEMSTSILTDDADESFVLTEFREIGERKR